MTYTILLTGIGAPGTSGTAKCLEGHRLIGCDKSSDPANTHLVEAWVQVPEPGHPSYLPAIERICKLYHVDVILPQTTAEVEYLSRTKRQIELWEGCRVRVACGNGHAVKGANDKAAVMRTFKLAGLPSPRFMSIENMSDLMMARSTFGSPFVVKPRRSNGSRGVRIIGERKPFMEKPDGRYVTLNQLMDDLNGIEWPDLLAMEYLPGPEYSVDGFRGLYAEAALPRLRKQTRGGICTHAVVDRRQDLVGYSLEAAKHLGLTGAFGFQYRLDEKGVPKVIECNPRIMGTMVTSYYAGFNVPLLAVQEAMQDFPREINISDARVEYRRVWSGTGFVNGIAA